MLITTATRTIIIEDIFLNYGTEKLYSVFLELFAVKRRSRFPLNDMSRFLVGVVYFVINENDQEKSFHNKKIINVIVAAALKASRVGVTVEDDEALKEKLNYIKLLINYTTNKPL